MPPANRVPQLLVEPEPRVFCLARVGVGHPSAVFRSIRIPELAASSCPASAVSRSFSMRDDCSPQVPECVQVLLLLNVIEFAAAILVSSRYRMAAGPYRRKVSWMK